MAAPNIVNVSTITGKTNVSILSTSATDVVSNPASSGKVFKINTVFISNVDGTNAADVTVSVFRSSVEYKIVSTVSVPADATLTVITKDTSIYLEEGDALRMSASANNDLESVCSYEEIS